MSIQRTNLLSKASPLFVLMAVLALAPDSVTTTAHADTRQCPLEDGAITAALGGPTNASPPGEILYINGLNTTDEKAMQEATATGHKLNHGVRLVYDDLTGGAIDDANLATSKLVGSCAFNKATDAVEGETKKEIEAGRNIYLIGFSAGAIMI